MNKTIKKIFREHFFFILFCLLYFIALAYKMIFHAQPFYDWDESLYVQSGVEMFKHRYFFFPVWQGMPWLDKPPLIPFLYGLIIKIFFFIPAEISVRIFTLVVSITVLVFVYKLYLKVIKDKLLVNLTVIITALTPIFLQRTQVGNLDVFLLLGWLGYLLFFNGLVASTIFLLIAVMSKSLIGFFPIAIFGFYYLYLLLIKKVKGKEFKKNFGKLVFQIFIGMLWFLAMFFMYGKQFFYQHIIESHFRRVTSSIEFHFGTRTFYLELALQQFGLYVLAATGGLIYIIIGFFRKKIKEDKILYAIYLLPWFLFLNLTKTKIFWYLYPAIPQIAFLAVYPINLLKKNRLIYLGIFLFVLINILYTAVFTNKLFQTYYAKYEDYYYLSLYAKKECNQLFVLLNPQKRTDFETLDKLGLLITTTKWWGEHPSMVYYFGKKIDFLYDRNIALLSLFTMKKNQCLTIEKEDLSLEPESKLTFQKQFGKYYLYRKN